jgi:hypothetical protein
MSWLCGCSRPKGCPLGSGTESCDQETRRDFGRETPTGVRASALADDAVVAEDLSHPTVEAEPRRHYMSGPPYSPCH